MSRICVLNNPVYVLCVTPSQNMEGLPILGPVRPSRRLIVQNDQRTIFG